MSEVIQAHHRLQPQNNLFKRILWLYGLHSLLSNATFLLGYYLLPEGFLRGSALGALAEFVAAPESFWPEFGRTLLTNLGIVAVLCIALNLMQVNGFPLGYTYPISLGITGGLVSGTNSFLLDDLSRYSAREGMALGLFIGGVEMLGYILIIAATANLGIYQRPSWLKWADKFVKVKNWREIRLSSWEILSLVFGITLVIIGAYRETMMAMSL